MMLTPTPILLAPLILGIPAMASAAPATDLSGAIERAAIERAALPAASELTVGQVRPADRALVASARRIFRVELPPGEAGTGVITGRAHVELEDGSEAWTWITARVDARVPILVATRDLARGHVLAAADTRVVLGEPSGDTLTEPGLAAGQRLGRHIRGGEPLRARWLSAPPIVRRGQGVELLVRAGAVAIRARGEALTAGAAGERIRVRIEGSRRSIHGTITGPGRVEVQP